MSTHPHEYLIEANHLWPLPNMQSRLSCHNWGQKCGEWKKGRWQGKQISNLTKLISRSEESERKTRGATFGRKTGLLAAAAAYDVLFLFTARSVRAFVPAAVRSLRLYDCVCEREREREYSLLVLDLYGPSSREGGRRRRRRTISQHSLSPPVPTDQHRGRKEQQQQQQQTDHALS